MIQDPKNIIIKMPNWIGDAVMATPILEDLKNRWNFAKVSVLCQPSVAALISCNPYVDEVLSYQKPNGWVHRIGHKDVIEPLRKGDFDLGILLTNSFSSAYWFWKGNVRNRIGFSNGLRNIFLNKAVPYPKSEKQHLIVTYKTLLQPLDIPLSQTMPKLYLSDKEKQFAKNFLINHGITEKSRIIGINPGAAYGSAKCWPPAKFQDTALKLLEDPNISILFFGDSTGKPLVDQICKNMPPERVINLAGKTSLRELMALIHSCSIFLTNDSGPMHIASAFNVPLLALFGSTNEMKTGPYHRETVIHKHVPCSPCYLRKCPKSDFPCMEKIEVEEVYNQLRKMIENPNE